MRIFILLSILALLFSCNTQDPEKVKPESHELFLTVTKSILIYLYCNQQNGQKLLLSRNRNQHWRWLSVLPHQSLITGFFLMFHRIWGKL
jgi:hypothetical protein